MFLFVRADWKGLGFLHTYFSYLAYENALLSKENRAFKQPSAPNNRRAKCIGENEIEKALDVERETVSI